MKNNKLEQLEQLLTELTPEEGAVVEGGARIRLLSLTPVGNPIENDPAILVGTRQIYSAQNVNTFRFLFRTSPEFGSDTNISIWDQDGGSATDDLLGQQNVTSVLGLRTLNAVTNGRGYRLRYRVIP